MLVAECSDVAASILVSLTHKLIEADVSRTVDAVVEIVHRDIEPFTVPILLPGIVVELLDEVVCRPRRSQRPSS